MNQFKLNRRQFVETLSTLSLYSLLPLGFSCKVDGNQKNELLINQLVNESNDTNHMLFYNLRTQEKKILAIPHKIHGVLPIRNNREFLLTAKGGYLLHTTMDKVISVRKSPKDIMFYGHSSFLEHENTIYTSAIKIRGYDHKPRRRAKKVFKDDDTFAHGMIYKIKIDNLEIEDSFPSNGTQPHDQRYIGNDQIFVLNSGGYNDINGRVTIFNTKTQEVVNEFSCNQESGYCALAHMFGKNDELAIVGVSDESSIVFYDGQKLSKYKFSEVDYTKYKSGEMLNAAFSSDKTRVCSTNIDNGFIGLWDFKTGNLLKHLFVERPRVVVSVNTYKDNFVVQFHDSLGFYDRDLNLVSTVKIQEFAPENYFIYGPHSTLI